MTQPPPSYPPPPPSGPPPSTYPPYPATYAPFPPAPRRRRLLPVLLALVVAVALVAAAVLVPLLLSKESVDTSNLDAVETWDVLSTEHLEVGEDFDYPQSPPVGGAHAPIWLECGVYDEPLPEVNAVHDLEHGTTWITYRPGDVDADGIDRLADQLPANGLLSPYPDQAAPVVITVWGRQLELLGPDDPRIALFIAEYGAGDTAPEPSASCNGGLDPADLADLPGRGPVV